MKKIFELSKSEYLYLENDTKVEKNNKTSKLDQYDRNSLYTFVMVLQELNILDCSV